MLLVRQCKFHPGYSQEANREKKLVDIQKDPLGMKERLKVKAACVTGREGSPSVSDKMVCLSVDCCHGRCVVWVASWGEEEMSKDCV